MSGNSDGKARFELTGLPEGFTAAVSKAITSLDHLKERVNGTSEKLHGLTGGFDGFIASVGVLAGASGLVALITHALHTGDEIQKMSVRTGVATDKLQELQHAAGLSGVSTEELEKGLKFLNKALGEAAAGQENAIHLFEDLGVNVRDSNGQIRQAADVLDDVAEKFKKTEDAATRVRLAQELFGRSGTNLIPMLERGKEGLREMREEAHRLGLVLDKEMVAEAEKAHDELEKIASAIRVQVTRAILQMTPQILEAAEAFVHLLEKGKAFVDYFGHDRFVGIGELTLRLREARAELAALERDAKAGTFAGAAGPKSVQDALAAARKRIADLEALMKQREATKAVTAPTDSESSAKQKQGIEKVGSEFVQKVAGEKERAEIEAFRKTVDDLAGTLDPKMAASVRALAKAFDTWKTSVLEAGKALDAIKAGKDVSTWLGLGDNNIFQGIQAARSVDDAVGDIRKAIAQLAKDGVPAASMFDTINTMTQALGANLMKLKDQYADQPAVVEMLTQKQRQFGQSGEKLREELDGTVRALANLKQGAGVAFDESETPVRWFEGARSKLVEFIDTTDGINRVFIPRLQNGGAQVTEFTNTVKKMGPAFDDVFNEAGIQVVTLTGHVWDLARAFNSARIEALRLAGVAVGVGQTTTISPPGNF